MRHVTIVALSLFSVCVCVCVRERERERERERCYERRGGKRAGEGVGMTH